MHRVFAIVIVLVVLAAPAGRVEAEDGSMESRCRLEVEELHQFFQDWFNAASSNEDAVFERFSDVLGERFAIITPDGRKVERGPLLDGLRGAYGRWRSIEGGGRIWIENFDLRHVEAETALATYEEWQQEGDGKRGRLSTVLFRRKNGTPNGVEWLHVHEVWLPE